MFEKLDKDNNGILTPYEINDSAGEIFGELGYEDSEWKQIIDQMDANGDGQISYNEFLVAASNHRNMVNTENLKNLFEMIDLDRNGVISTDELKAAFQAQQDDE